MTDSDSLLKINLPKSMEEEMTQLGDTMDKIDAVVGGKLSGLTVELLSDSLDNLSLELQYVGKMVSRASFISDLAGGVATLALMEHPKYKDLKDTEKRKLIAAMTAKYSSLYMRAEKTERCLEKRIDAVRSTLSAEKEVMSKMSPNNNN